MATALPRTGIEPIDPAPTCNTDDMRIVHGLLRALFLDAAALVRTVRADQPRRRDAVSAHVAFVSAALASHHQVEDVLLWDDLERRAPKCALHVGLMRRQHAEMHGLLMLLDQSVAAWNVLGGADDGSVSAHLDEIRAVLDQHLGDEELWILPIASATLTQEEWNRLGEMGGSHTPKGKAFILLGYLLQSMPQAERGPWMRANMPLPLRLIWALFGRRRFTAYRRTLGVEA
jgi:hemerythrin-like domain-containing protein